MCLELSIVKLWEHCINTQLWRRQGLYSPASLHGYIYLKVQQPTDLVTLALNLIYIDLTFLIALIWTDVDQIKCA